MSYWASYTSVLSTVTNNLTPLQMLDEFPYAMGRQLVDCAQQKSGVDLVPLSGEESAREKFRKETGHYA